MKGIIGLASFIYFGWSIYLFVEIAEHVHAWPF